MGSKGDSVDNALAETINGLDNAELVQLADEAMRAAVRRARYRQGHPVFGRGRLDHWRCAAIDGGWTAL